jgi:uroporphyrin-III C-methyltransferase
LKGKVYLVGAGPGDPELLTVKAVNRLRTADVVLHDALVSAEVLALVSSEAQVLNVGKRCGAKCISQDEINSLLVRFATDGNMVMRLKSGDPLLFGRGGEELDTLREAGIEVEIVPGITAAVAAAASLGVTLTDRRGSEQVLMVSAHSAPGKPERNWGELISRHTTIVIYMPGCHKRIAEGLLRAGLHDHTSCVVISKISMPEELAYRTTLGTLSDAPSLPTPSLLIVGANVANSALPQFQSAFWSRSAGK